MQYDFLTFQSSKSTHSSWSIRLSCGLEWAEKEWEEKWGSEVGVDGMHFNQQMSRIDYAVDGRRAKNNSYFQPQHEL